MRPRLILFFRWAVGGGAAAADNVVINERKEERTQKKQTIALSGVMSVRANWWTYLRRSLSTVLYGNFFTVLLSTIDQCDWEFEGIICYLELK